MKLTAKKKKNRVLVNSSARDDYFLKRRNYYSNDPVAEHQRNLWVQRMRCKPAGDHLHERVSPINQVYQILRAKFGAAFDGNHGRYFYNRQVKEDRRMHGSRLTTDNNAHLLKHAGLLGGCAQRLRIIVWRFSSRSTR